MNRRGFLGRVLAVVAAGPLARVAPAPTPAPKVAEYAVNTTGTDYGNVFDRCVLTYHGVPITVTSTVPQNTIYYVNPQYYRMNR